MNQNLEKEITDLNKSVSIFYVKLSVILLILVNTNSH